MIRLASLTALLVFVMPLSADPIKKDKPPEFDKLAKEQVEKFWKAILDEKIDDAIAMMGLPFLMPDGKLEETHDKFKQEFSRGKPAGVEVKTLDAVEPKKLNEYLKDKKMKELPDDKVATYEKHIGKDGRIVVLQVSMNGQAPPTQSPVMLITFDKDKKPKIVGVGGAR